jgi:hypothetical protein
MHPRYIRLLPQYLGSGVSILYTEYTFEVRLDGV